MLSEAKHDTVCGRDFRSSKL